MGSRGTRWLTAGLLTVGMALPGVAQRVEDSSGTEPSYWERIGSGTVHGTLVNENREQDRSARRSRSRSRPESAETSAPSTPQRTRPARSRREREGSTEAPPPGEEQGEAQQAQAEEAPASAAQQPARDLTPGQEMIPAMAAARAAQGGGAGAEAGDQQGAAQAPRPVGNAMPLAQTAVVFLTPTTVNVLEGEEFATTLELRNPQGRPFNRIAVCIAYNSAAIEPLGRRPLTLMQEAAEVRVEHSESAGLVWCELQFDSPRADARAQVVEIRWRARREVRSTPVVFLREGAGETFVGMAGGESILGNPARESQGVVDADVRISPNLAPHLASDEAGTVRLPWVDTGQTEEAPVGGISLHLSPRRGSTSVGDYLDVDVVVQNPMSAVADDVAFAITFDPEAVEVIDTHSGNWIERDTNIWDGPYHQRYPFDLHIENSADNQRGRIVYHMGFSQEMPLASGVIATVRLRALRPSDGVALRFDPERTAVRSLGENLLGSPGEEAAALVGATVAVTRQPVAEHRPPAGPIS